MSELEIASQGSLADSRPVRRPSPTLPWWLQAIVLLGALLMVAGALIALLNPAMLVSPGDEINAAVHIYAGYLFSRNAALAVLLVASLLFRSKATLNTLILLTAFIQLLDTSVDCMEGRWAIALGVLIFGLLFLVASRRLSGHPFWRKDAWTQSQ
jgi:hypothetical protein